MAVLPDELERTIKVLQTELQQKSTQVSNLDAAHAKAKEKLKESEAARDTLTRENQQLSRQTSESELQLLQKNNELRLRSLEMSQLKDQTRTLTEKYDTLQVEHQRALDQLQQRSIKVEQLEEQIKNLTQQLQRANDQLHATGLELEAAKQEALRATTEMRNYETKLVTKSEEWAQEKFTLETQWERERRVAGQAVQAEVDKARQMKRTWDDEKATLQSNLQALQTRIEGLEVDLEKARTRVAWTQQDSTNLKNEWELKTANMKRVMDHQAVELSSLQSKKQAAEETAQRLTATLEREAERARQLAGSVEDLKARLNVEVTARTAAEEERDRTRVGAETAATTAQEEYQKLMLAKCELSSELQVIADALERKEEDYTALEVVHKAQCQQHDQMCRQLHTQVAEEQERSVKLSQQLQEMRERWEKERTDFGRRHEQRCDQLRDETDQRLTEAQQRMAECDALKAALKAAQREAEIAKSERTKANFAAAKIEEDLRVEMRRLDRDWQRRVDTLQQEKTALETRHSAEQGRWLEQRERMGRDLKAFEEEVRAKGKSCEELTFERRQLMSERDDLMAMADKASQQHEAEVRRLLAERDAAEQDHGRLMVTMEDQFNSAQELVRQRDQELFCLKAELRTAGIDQEETLRHPPSKSPKRAPGPSPLGQVKVSPKRKFRSTSMENPGGGASPSSSSSSKKPKLTPPSP